MICPHDLFILANVFVMELLPQVGKQMPPKDGIYHLERHALSDFRILLPLLSQLADFFVLRFPLPSSSLVGLMSNVWLRLVFDI